MKKVFVSLPMTGRSKEDILSEQKRCRRIVETMLDDSAVLLPTFFEEEAIPEHVVNSSVWSLGSAIVLLASADVVVFAPGSRKCRGCKVERLIANLYRIPTIDLSTYGLISPTTPTLYADNKIVKGE